MIQISLLLILLVSIIKRNHTNILQVFGMGSSHIKDENLNKQFYISGEWVQGQVYLKIAKTSSYTKLVIVVEGQEYVYWTEGSGNNRRRYENRYKNYSSSFILHDFHSVNAQQGDYIFPFALLLPSMMTGSFFHSKHCFLKYTIKCELLHINQVRRNQLYEMFLNILQPPRNPFGPITTTKTVNSKCCGCCSDYGHISATLTCDKNFVMNGDLVQVAGCIDNTRGNTLIDSGTVVLQRRICKISSGDNVQDSVQEGFEFHRVGPIQPQNSYNFNFVGKIPDNLIHCTAIGKIVSMYYVLHLYTNYGCCANKADAQLHLIFHSKTPMIVRPQNISQPQSWYPMQHPLVTYQQMTPYIYVPHPKIPFINQISIPMMNMNMNNNNNLNNQYSYQQANQNLMTENSQNRMVENETWDSNRGYRPVFYDHSVMSDAQRQYNNRDKQDQNAIFKKL